MRKTDDLIISTINTVVPTDSFHPDAVTSCKNLRESLEVGNLKRHKLIKTCISITADQVKNLKDQREVNLDDITISKNLRAEQTKVISNKESQAVVKFYYFFQLRMLQVELSVENLIQQRTAKVFNEKCKKYYKPL